MDGCLGDFHDSDFSPTHSLTAPKSVSEGRLLPLSTGHSHVESLPEGNISSGPSLHTGPTQWLPILCNCLVQWHFHPQRHSFSGGLRTSIPYPYPLHPVTKVYSVSLKVLELPFHLSQPSGKPRWALTSTSRNYGGRSSPM